MAFLDKKNSEKIAVGVMSGTSLDGLDLALVRFIYTSVWEFEVINTQFIPYTKCWEQRLNNALHLSSIELMLLNNKFGKFIGEKVSEFIGDDKVDLIASHGHTVFHQPEKGLTLQIGSGAEIASATGLKVINDFRVLDVALKGQGAPLVPVGDNLLFANYEMCLNLGGFANISVKSKKEIEAFDICPVNIVLNALANEIGLPYDKNGRIAANGEVNKGLLNELNKLPFYVKSLPKSLGKEWVNEFVFPLLKSEKDSIENKIATFTQHIVEQLSNVIAKDKGNVLVTGGGAYNQSVISGLKKNFGDRIVIPEKQIIDFKEAIVFAFLGVLRDVELDNCLQSVTGAFKNNCGGSVWIG